MSPIIEINSVLVEIASPLAREADTLLDLRAAATAQPHPGRCVSCYFKLLAAAPSDLTPRLTPLRRWLEQNIEITACAPAGETLDIFPLDLSEAHTLADYCHRSINTVYEDRNYGPLASVALSFRFRQPASPSAPATSTAA